MYIAIPYRDYVSAKQSRTLCHNYPNDDDHQRSCRLVLKFFPYYPKLLIPVSLN
jgi:hypothetical protein